jgi:hypothetical protein
MYQRSAKKVGVARRAAPTINDFGEHFGGMPPTEQQQQDGTAIGGNDGSKKAKGKDGKWV